MKENIVNQSDCPHTNEMKTIKSNKIKCDACELDKDLRLCTSCGEVNCSESGNAHDTEHFKKTGHPVIKTTNVPYNFTWCYKCNAYLIP